MWFGHLALAPANAAGAADAMLLEVSSALAAGQCEQAITVADSGLEEAGLSDLTRGRLLIVRGIARQALGANDDALADFTEGLSVDTLPTQDRARALFARGVTLDSLGRLDDAVGDYSAVLKLTPGATYALNNRANVWRRQGRLDDARRDYLVALKGENPNPQYPFFGLGQIAEAQGNTYAARDYYSKALTAVPSFPLAFERLQALGTPVEGAAGLVADTGVIVLKPPPANSEAVAVLHPPGEISGIAVAPTARFRPAPPTNPVRAGTAVSQRNAPLRPAIVEGWSASRGPLAQLGAWRSEQAAREGWTMARDGADGAMDGLTPLIVRAEIPGRGVYYRLRTAPLQRVSQFCMTLIQKGLTCIAVRQDA